MDPTRTRRPCGGPASSTFATPSAVSPSSSAKAILLREVRGFSYDEIATSLSLSPSAVESLIFRARRGVQLRLRNAWAALSPFGWFTSLRELFVQLAAGGDPGAGPLAVKAATIGLGTAVIAGSAFFGPQALHGNRAHAVRASAASTIAPAGHVKLPSRPAVAPTVLPTNSRPTASSPAAPATHRAPVVGRQLRGPDDTRELQRPAGVLLLRSRTTAAHELGDVAEPGDGAAVTRATTAAASPQSPTDDGPDSSSGGPDD